MHLSLNLIKRFAYAAAACQVYLAPCLYLLAADNPDHYSPLLTVFKEALEVSPKNRLPLLNKYADQLSFASQAHLAIPLYEEVLASDPDPEEKKKALIGLARAYTWRENYEQALATNQKILEIDPHYNQYDFFLTLARDAAVHKKPEMAVQYYQKALEINPEQKNALLREYAKQLSYAYRAQEAIPLYQEHLKQKLSSEEERLTRLDLAEAYVWTKQYPLAIAEYELLLKQNPQDVQTRDALTDLWISFARFDAKNNNHTSALNWYLNAISLNPDKRASLLREYADEVSKSGQGPEAVILYKEILAGCPSVEEARLTKLGLAQTYIWLNKHQEALNLYEDLLSLNPDDTEAKKGKARVYIDYARYDAGQGNRDKAIDWFQKAIELDPEQKPQLLKELADQLRYSTQTDRAITLYKEMLTTNPSAEDVRMMHLNLAQAYASKFQYDEALKEYDGLLQLNRYDQIAKQGKAQVYIEYALYNSKQNKHAEAIEWYTKAIENDPIRRPELLRKIEAEKRLLNGKKQEQPTPIPSQGPAPPPLPVSKTESATTIEIASPPPAETPKQIQSSSSPEKTIPIEPSKTALTPLSQSEQAPSSSPALEEKKEASVQTDSSTPSVQPQKTPEERNQEWAKKISQQAQEYAKRLEVFQAKRAFETSLALDPNNRGYREQYAWHLQAFAFHEETAAQFYLLLPEATDPALLYTSLGWELRALGQLDTSVWAFSQVYSIPCHLTLSNQLIVAGNVFRQKEREKIYGWWNELEDGCADEWEIKKKLFEHYTYLRDLPMASSLAEEILSAHPEEYMVHYRYANLLYQMRKFSRAACQYQLLIEKLPDNSFLYLSLGKVYEDMGDLCDAEIAYQTAMALDQNPKTERAYARILSKLHNCCEAAAISQAIVSTENDSLTTSLSAAEVNLNCKNEQEAACIYHSVLDIYPFNQEALWGLLKSSTYTGNTGDALLSYRRWPKIWFDDPLQNRLAPYYRPPELIFPFEYFKNSTTFQRFSTGLSFDHYAINNLRLYENYYYTRFSQQGFDTINRHSVSLYGEKLFNKKWEGRATFIGNYYDKLQHRSLNPTHHSLYSKGVLNYRLHAIYHPTLEWTADIGYDYYDVIDTIPPFGNPIYNYSNQIGATALNIRTHDVNAFFYYSKDKWSALANFIHGNYSDRNTKNSRSFRIDYRFCDLPSSSIYYSYFYLDFQKAAPLFTQNGQSESAYYDPKNLEIHSIGLYTNYDVTECLRLGGETALLYIPKCRNFAYSAFGYFNYQFACRWTMRLDLRYYYQNQSLGRHEITGYYNAESANFQVIYQF